jgi:hypothetical protein
VARGDPQFASRSALRYHRVVFTDPATMTEEQRQWVGLSRKLWRRAERIAAQHPGMDVSGVYHVLWNLRRSVEERPRRGLARRAPSTQ